MWCATGVNLSGGVTKDGGAIVGASVFYNNNVEKLTDIDTELEMTTDESMEMKILDEELKVVNYLNDLYLFININQLYYSRKIVDQISNQNWYYPHLSGYVLQLIIILK